MVVMLLETPFRRWHSDNKNDLLKVGKTIPILSALAPDKKLSKVFCRSFNPNLYQQHSWLCGSHYIQKLFCWPCLLLGKMKSVWNTVGYYDLKNLSRGIQIHQTSKEHIHNHLGLKNLEKNYFSILDVVNEHGNLFKKNYNENVRLNRLFMEHLIDLVLFLGKQELAFRGHDENSDSLNKGNFRELFDMHIIRCSQEIQNHYNSIKNIFSGMSKSIQNDLISCISEFLINQIKNEIKQCKFYSIQIDDTTDISQKTQCSIIIRYVTDKSELVERFLGFHNVSEDRTAQGLFNLVNSVLHEFDIENKLVGQCYDEACVMSGHLTGLQARVKEVAPNALFTHCLAHRLNLVLQHGCSINAKCRIFFANLTGIAAYFHNSTSRTNFVDTIVGKRIPQFVQTRWSSRSKILHTIVNEWSGFINVFDCISKDPKSSSESICGAIGHFKNLKTFEFAFLVFNDIFIYTDNLFNILQNKSFDVEFCLRKINITYDLINKKRNEPEFLKLFNQAVTLTKPPKATRNESNNQSNFKILFYEIIDNILMQLNTRFQDTNKLLFLQLADVTKFKEYSCTCPVSALNNLKSTYPKIFYNINTLKIELEVLYSDVKYQNLLHIYDIVKIIEQDALKDILPEAYKLFILILTIPSTSVSNERSFSCLKRIKTCSRNSISQVRLSSLSILSIEKSLINQLKKTESFYDDIINIYKNDSDFSIFIKMIVALSFVPIDNLDAAIRQLGDDLPECLQPLLDWFEDNYVGKVNRNGRGRRTALFPPHIWNLHQRVLNGQDRTNNHAEAANRRLNVEIGVKNPSLWSFIDCLRKVQAGRDVFYNQLEAVLFGIKLVKQVFLKAPSLTILFKIEAPGILLPPEPIPTHWGTWLQAVSYYCQYFKEINKFYNFYIRAMQFLFQKLKSAISQYAVYHKNMRSTKMDVVYRNFFGTVLLHCHICDIVLHKVVNHNLAGI
ncbi:hypothetical protein QTP88_025991 [Uroleucon formosanum]